LKTKKYNKAANTANRLHKVFTHQNGNGPRKRPIKGKRERNQSLKEKKNLTFDVEIS